MRNVLPASSSSILPRLSTEYASASHLTAVQRNKAQANSVRDILKVDANLSISQSLRTRSIECSSSSFFHSTRVGLHGEGRRGLSFGNGFEVAAIAISEMLFRPRPSKKRAAADEANVFGSKRFGEDVGDRKVRRKRGPSVRRPDRRSSFLFNLENRIFSFAVTLFLTLFLLISLPSEWKWRIVKLLNFFLPSRVYLSRREKTG